MVRLVHLPNYWQTSSRSFNTIISYLPLESFPKHVGDRWPRLLLRRPQSLRSGRVMVVAVAVLAEVVLVGVLAEVVLLDVDDDSVHAAVVPCLSCSNFYDVPCLALLLCS